MLSHADGAFKATCVIQDMSFFVVIIMMPPSQTDVTLLGGRTELPLKNGRRIMENTELCTLMDRFYIGTVIQGIYATGSVYLLLVLVLMKQPQFAVLCTKLQ